ncbi:hypothetical protein EHS25_002551 [Saitozyma podzolica]|uniref:Uncharacterized protein n=1 Tax=Saitozyma podzolica TaxID=1890683 RepID=A0A427YCJ0_9TREE|nr:hypothetical protein EHS25_002551 [Saitozyma podzolica]
MGDREKTIPRSTECASHDHPAETPRRRPLNHHDTANTPGALTPNTDVESSGAVNPNPDASWGKAGKLGKVGKVGKVRELMVAPAVVLGRHIPRIISERKKEVYSSAAARAREAGEVLVYGRVFSESVLADLTWTRNDLPFELPAKFWKPTWHPSLPGLTGWLARLRWDPRVESFARAWEAMGRWYDIGAGWKGQPVKESPWQWPPPGSPPSRSNGMTMGTVPVVDPHPDVQKSNVVLRPGVPTTSQQAGNQSGLEASSNVVKNGPTENRRSDGVRSSQNSADSKTVKLGVPAETKESLSGRSIEPSSNSLTRGTEKAGKPVKGKTKAQDEPKPKPKPKPARRPLEPIKEGVLVEFTS